MGNVEVAYHISIFTPLISKKSAEMYRPKLLDDIVELTVKRNVIGKAKYQKCYLAYIAKIS